MTAPVQLGPFRLTTTIGAGGMATVWHALHEGTGLGVAVKVMQGAQARDPRFVAAFNEEVRHAASLAHPAIVTVLDYGRVPAEVGDTGLVPDSPYLVIELAEAGSLDQHPLPLAWEALDATLSTLLEALAHAHARGVLHLDLKPANVLCTRTGGLDAGSLRLSDFGLARAFQEAPDAATLAGGTPEFMPPEQVERRWRDQGPWTDLYALGCLAWQLATGRYLFRVPGDPLATARLHVSPNRPSLVDPPGVPEGFAAWVARLTAWDPAERPPHAAAALRELHALRDAPLVSPPSTLHPQAGEGDQTTPTFLLDDDEPTGDAPPDAGSAALTQAFLDAAPVPSDDSTLRRALAPTLPLPSSTPSARSPAAPPDTRSTWPTGGPFPDWRAPHPLRPPVRLAGAGLGLFPLRRFPLVGRGDEHEVLWQALREAATERRPRVVLLEGALGVGRTRLATAVAERALELGVASVLHVTHERIRGAGDGILPALQRHFRLGGLSPTDQEARLRARLGEATEAAILLRDELPPGVDERDRQAWRHAALTRLLARLTRHGSLLILLDDAEQGPEDVAFVTDLLAGRGRPFAGLVVVCAGDTAASPELAAVRTHRDVRRLVAAPLPDADVGRLLGDHLLLEDEAARDVARRAAGNPLVAVQLVRGWADRGLLEEGPHGFRPAPGAPLDVGIRQVWEDVIQRVALAAGPDTRAALRVAAALGVEVRTDEWVRACAALGHPVPGSLTESLLRAGLVVATDEGWRFSHPLVQETLEEDLLASGMATFVHAALADLLLAATRADAARIVRHLLAAGREVHALDLALASARAHLDGLAFREALRVLDPFGPCPVQGVRRTRVELEVLRARALMGAGRTSEAIAAANNAEPHARAHAWSDLRARALRYRAIALEKQGDLDTAAASFIDAQALAGEVGDDETRATCLEHRGTLARQRGDLTASRAFLEEALGVYRSLGQLRLVADGLKELGGTLVRAADTAVAVGVLEEAHALYRRIGSAGGAAEALNNLAEVARASGRLDEAERNYLASYEAMEQLGHAASIIPLLNLAQIQLARRDWTAAEHTVRRAVEACEQGGRRAGLLYALAFSLPPHAVGERWSAWDDALTRAEGLTAETGLRDEEIAAALELAATLADAPARVTRARALATVHRNA